MSDIFEDAWNRGRKAGQERSAGHHAAISGQPLDATQSAAWQAGWHLGRQTDFEFECRRRDRDFGEISHEA